MPDDTHRYDRLYIGGGQEPDAVAVSDKPIGPGQYRHVATHAWWMASMASTGSLPERYSYLAEVISNVWVPSDQQRDWLMDRRVTGRRVWIQGSEKQAVAAGFDVIDRWPSGRWQAPYGDFFAVTTGRQPGPREDSWQIPTPDFLAALPRDPRQLLDRLQADSPDDRPGYTGAFVYATDALRTGLVPADLRAALYRALLMLPGVRITHRSETGNEHDLSLSIDNGARRGEILISGADGQFAGERSVFTRDIGDFRAGTEQTSTTVVITVVDRMGQTGAVLTGSTRGKAGDTSQRIGARDNPYPDRLGRRLVIEWTAQF